MTIHEDEPTTWYVTYPICGSVTVRVEAPDEKTAIEDGWNHQNDDDAELMWEAMEHISTGNVFWGSTNNIYAERES